MVNAETAPSGSAEIRNEARVNPATGRAAGPREGGILLAVSALPILGAVLLAPNLNTMNTVFAATPGVDALVPLVLSVPAIFIALIAPIAGYVVDKVGRKRVLITVMIAYAALGTAPLYIDSLWGILASRIGVGITEAFIITGCTAMIADYFTAGRRNKYLGLQAVTAALSATVFLVVGGALGGIGWRIPFWLYALSIPIALLVLLFVWPTRTSDDGSEKRIEKLAKLPLRPLLVPVAITLFGGVVFYILIVELSYLLEGVGIEDPKIVGLVGAISSLATAAGAILFRRLAALGARRILTGEFAVAGVGLLVVSVAGGVPVIVVGAVITSFATGALLPTLIVWAIARLPYEQRGRGTGAFTSALFVGQFCCPLIVTGLRTLTGSLGTAIAVLGVVCFVLAGLVALVLRSTSMSELKG